MNSKTNLRQQTTHERKKQAGYSQNKIPTYVTNERDCEWNNLWHDLLKTVDRILWNSN